MMLEAVPNERSLVAATRWDWRYAGQFLALVRSGDKLDRIY
jgi:hypothetical protein